MARFVQANRRQTFHLPAPLGGVNTIDAGTAMPATDSIYSYNLIGAEYGLRSRLGWREWCTNLGGEQVRSLLPFAGSTKDGSNNRLFACTQSGIWDVSSSSASPTKVLTFGTQGPDSGWGVSTGFVNGAGYHFLCYCDEANGYYVYAEVGGTWIKVSAAATTDWKPNTAYSSGDYVVNGGISYKCSSSGTSVGVPWAPGHAYGVGDVCVVDGLTYRCIKSGTSQGAPWAASTAYRVGQMVTNGNAAYVCTTAGVSQVDVAAWAPATAYVVGRLVTNGGNHYRCIKAGTSAGSGGPSGSGTAIDDNTAQWSFTTDAIAGPVGQDSAIKDGAAAWRFSQDPAAGPGGFGESIADDTVTWAWGVLGPSGTGSGISDGTTVWAYTPSLGGVDPGNVAFVMAWKNRLWLVERDTARAWFLPLGAVYGTASPFNFGARFKAGGDLRGLWNWTIDGLSGIDDALVAISGGGDVLVYKGTDPSSSATFGLQGVSFVGAVPAGRRLCTDTGGDLLVMSSIGILPMSKLVVGSVLYDRTQYQTNKISNLFNQAQAATSTMRGWAMRLHPQDAALMVLTPIAPNQPSQQLVMSMVTKGWHQYRDMPVGVCAEAWNGTLYFGTEDGRVCVNDGYVDGVLLSDPNSYSTINWSMLSAFSNLGTPTNKRVQEIRVGITSQGGAVPYQAAARFGFDFNEITGVSASPGGGPGSAWDSALWDQAVWGGAYQPQSRVFGGAGMGREVAVAIRGAASSRMTITGIDVSYDSGGFL